MDPIFFRSSAEEAQAAVRETIQSMARARVTHEEPGYLRAEFTSRFFGFVDDVELVVDGVHGRIDFRSASRLGHSDWGVNRRRMERICRRLARHPGISA